MGKLVLQKCIVGSVFTNCYFLKNKETGEMLIIDPGDNAEKIEQKILEMQGKPVAILLTHGHFAHATGAGELAQLLPQKLFATDIRFRFMPVRKKKKRFRIQKLI